MTPNKIVYTLCYGILMVVSLPFTALYFVVAYGMEIIDRIDCLIARWTDQRRY